MPDEDKNFGGSLVLDFRKWRHMQVKNSAESLIGCTVTQTYIVWIEFSEIDISSS